MIFFTFAVKSLSSHRFLTIWCISENNSFKILRIALRRQRSRTGHGWITTYKWHIVIMSSSNFIPFPMAMSRQMIFARFTSRPNHIRRWWVFEESYTVRILLPYSGWYFSYNSCPTLYRYISRRFVIHVKRDTILFSYMITWVFYNLISSAERCRWN